MAAPSPVSTHEEDPGRARPRIGSMCTGYGGLDLAARAVYGGELGWCADNDAHAGASRTPTAPRPAGECRRAPPSRTRHSSRRPGHARVRHGVDAPTHVRGRAGAEHTCPGPHAVVPARKRLIGYGEPRWLPGPVRGSLDPSDDHGPRYGLPAGTGRCRPTRRIADQLRSRGSGRVRWSRRFSPWFRQRVAPTATARRRTERES
jgi:hypothetical protein